MSVVSDPDHPEMEFKFKLIHTEEIRNPCTAMCDVNGHLLACLGNKVICAHTYEAELGLRYL